MNGNEAREDCPGKEGAPIVESELDSWLFFFPSDTFKVLTLCPTGAKYHQVKYSSEHTKMGVTPKTNKR